jgi:hypothetical protein
VAQEQAERVITEELVTIAAAIQITQAAEAAAQVQQDKQELQVPWAATAGLVLLLIHRGVLQLQQVKI